MTAETMEPADFGQACARHHAALRAYIDTCLDDPRPGEGLVQQVLQLAARNRERFPAGGDLGAWLLTICRKLLEKERERREIPPATRPFIEEHAARLFTPEHYDTERLAVEEQALRACLAELPAADRDLLARQIAGGERYQELAAATGTPPGKLPVRMHKLRLALLECVNKRLRGGETDHG